MAGTPQQLKPITVEGVWALEFVQLLHILIIDYQPLSDMLFKLLFILAVAKLSPKIAWHSMQ
jgi:hypothetical protein